MVRVHLVEERKDAWFSRQPGAQLVLRSAQIALCASPQVPAWPPRSHVGSAVNHLMGAEVLSGASDTPME